MRCYGQWLQMILIVLCMANIVHPASCFPSPSDEGSRPPTVLSLPVDSTRFTKYFIKNEERFEFFLNPEYATPTSNFTGQESSVRLQGEMSSFVKSGWSYYELGRFHKDGRLYTIIAYNYPGEFDDPYLNVQLNSHSANGELLDALVLDTRYCFEDVEGFSEYTIDKKGIVSITSYVGYYWDADNLDAGTVAKPVHQLFRFSRYRIDNGYFKLLTKEEYPVSFINKESTD